MHHTKDYYNEQYLRLLGRSPENMFDMCTCITKMVQHTVLQRYSAAGTINIKPDIVGIDVTIEQRYQTVGTFANWTVRMEIRLKRSIVDGVDYTCVDINELITKAPLYNYANEHGGRSGYMDDRWDGVLRAQRMVNSSNKFKSTVPHVDVVLTGKFSLLSSYVPFFEEQTVFDKLSGKNSMLAADSSWTDTNTFWRDRNLFNFINENRSYFKRYFKSQYESLVGEGFLPRHHEKRRKKKN